jgi:hypothetical protein
MKKIIGENGFELILANPEQRMDTILNVISEVIESFNQFAIDIKGKDVKIYTKGVFKLDNSGLNSIPDKQSSEIETLKEIISKQNILIDTLKIELKNTEQLYCKKGEIYDK